MKSVQMEEGMAGAVAKIADVVEALRVPEVVSLLLGLVMPIKSKK